MGTDGLTLTCPSSTAAAWDRAVSQQESFSSLWAPCFQPDLRWMPDVSLCCHSDGRAAGCGFFAKVMDPGDQGGRVATCLGSSSTPGSSLEAWCS